MAPLRMRVPRRLVNLLSVHVAVLVVLTLHVPGLLMSRWSLPVPVPHVNPRAVPQAMLIARGMHVPGSLMTPPDVPLALMVPGVPMPYPMMAMDEEGTVVKGSQSCGEADHAQPVVFPLDRRIDQSADDATHDRAFPRPSRIGLNGRRRHGRAESDGGRECNASGEARFPASSHRHPPLSVASL